MNLIPPRIHGILDYGIVVMLLLAPELLFPTSVTGGTARLCYALAAVHLAMTLLTDFPLGMAEVIPLGLHGVVELIVSLALIVTPWILAIFFLGAQWHFTIFGVLLFAVWALTDYSGPRAASKTSVPEKHRARDRLAPDGKSTTGTTSTEQAAHEKTPRERSAAPRTTDEPTREERAATDETPAEDAIGEEKPRRNTPESSPDES